MVALDGVHLFTRKGIHSHSVHRGTTQELPKGWVREKISLNKGLILFSFLKENMRLKH
jgi:hypothetical protein